MACFRIVRILGAFLAVGSAWAFGQVSPADTLQAKVVAYASASAFAVLDPQQQLKRVKLTGIEAPEPRQPFAPQAQRLVAEYLGAGPVTINVDSVDAQQRIHGRISVDGRDLGLVLLEAGLSWCDPADSAYLPAALQTAYAHACNQAREQRRGLWHHANPVPPWEHRKIPQFDPLPGTRSDVRHCREIGYNTLQCDDGHRYRSVGSRVVGTDGTRYTRRGNSLIGNDGHRYERQGNTLYGSDGSLCRLRGRQVDCF
jgi:endonuclease YncB( thermonuclease family)